MSASASGFGSGAFSSGSYDSSAFSASAQDGGSFAEIDPIGEEHAALDTEVYVVPAPLAEFDGSGYWRDEVASAEDLEQLKTENVYVMTPIYDVIDEQMLLSFESDSSGDSSA
ncbi:MAG TPA: hypothetical protein VED01_24555 [Burkholderiales bacterium]|nr:hypothetical protein [Burkholderiales bacterium]